MEYVFVVRIFSFVEEAVCLCELLFKYQGCSKSRGACVPSGVVLKAELQMLGVERGVSYMPGTSSSTELHPLAQNKSK